MDHESSGANTARRSGRLLLLRHGEVVSHRGDQPLTDTGRSQAEKAGELLATRNLGSVRLLSGATRRAMETAQGVHRGLTTATSSTPLGSPMVSFALRNPDLYLGGDRVDMVSTAEAFAAQVPGMTPDEVTSVAFFSGFLTAPDRIGYWVRSEQPPGDDVTRVGARIAAFAASLGDRGPAAPDTVIGVTHSPILRAVAVAFIGEDPGEPPYVNGYLVEAHDGAVTAIPFDPFG